MEKTDLEYALGQLRALIAIPSPSGYTDLAVDYVMKELGALGYRPQKTVKGGVTVALGGEGAENALLLCCHLDTLGGMVAEVKETGRLRLAPIGGLSPNNTEGETVLVHTRGGKVYDGTFQLQQPSYHVNKDYETTQRTFACMEVAVDAATRSKEETRALGIDVGDFVSFEPRLQVTDAGYIKSRFLDDKLSCCILLALAKRLKEEAAVLPRRVYVHFTGYEEIGHGAAAFCPAGVTEVLGVDMGCVGEGVQCDEHMVSICAKDSFGPSSHAMVSRLVEVAEAKGLRYGIDVYPFYVSDPDAVLKAGFDVRHCVVGPGVNASHGYERSHVEGLANTYGLLEGYLLGI